MAEIDMIADQPVLNTELGCSHPIFDFN